MVRLIDVTAMKIVANKIAELVLFSGLTPMGSAGGIVGVISCEFVVFVAFQ